MKRFFALFVISALLTASIFPMAAYAAPKKKKAPEFGWNSVQQLTAKIVEINTTENFLMIQEENAKPALAAEVVTPEAGEAKVEVKTEVQAEGKSAPKAKLKPKKKVLMAGVVILKVTDSGVQVATVFDLVKNQKTHFWLKKTVGAKKPLQALIITQFLGSKVLASQEGTIQFSSVTSQGLEGAGLPSLSISLSKIWTKDVKVSYVVSGTATGGGLDYTLANGEITIPAGQIGVALPLNITNDTALETDETIIVTLSSPVNALLGPTNVHVYTIQDNDQPGVGFSSATGNGLESVSSVPVQATLTAASTQEVKVDYAVTGTATGGGVDYTLANGTITIPAGQTSGTITATIVDDTSLESSETIIVTLSNPRGTILGPTATYTYTINDNDLATVSFNATTSAGPEATTTVNIPVALSAASTQETRVNYAVTGGTATASGTDFTLANGMLTIPAGQVSGNIAVTVVDDTTDETDETIIVTLSNPVNLTLGTNVNHTYTVQDNDNPTVQFQSASSNGGENATPVNIAVTVSAAPAENVVVNYAVTGTATGGGTDYTLANGTVTINAGQTSANISLAVVDDAVADAGETVIITLSTPTAATLGATAVHTYTINDND